jgi:hypothetical protein
METTHRVVGSIYTGLILGTLVIALFVALVR